MVKAYLCIKPKVELIMATAQCDFRLLFHLYSLRQIKNRLHPVVSPLRVSSPVGPAAEHYFVFRVHIQVPPEKQCCTAAVSDRLYVNCFHSTQRQAGCGQIKFKHRNRTGECCEVYVWMQR